MKFMIQKKKPELNDWTNVQSINSENERKAAEDYLWREYENSVTNSDWNNESGISVMVINGNRPAEVQQRVEKRPLPSPFGDLGVGASPGKSHNFGTA